MIKYILIFLLLCSTAYAEPTINQKGLITWDCDDDTDYTLTNAVLDADDSGFRLTDTSTLLDELDDSDFSNWADSSNLSQDTSTKRFGTSSAEVKSSSADYSQINQTYRLWSFLRHSVMVKFNASGGVGDRSVQFLTDTGGLMTGFGIIPSVSAVNFSYWDNVVNDWVDTGYVINTDWNRISLAQYNLGSGTLRMGRGTVDSGLTVQAVKQIRAVTTNDTRWLNIDRVQYRGGDLYSGNGTIETPKAQPDKVYRWKTSSFSGTSDSFYAAYTSIALAFQWSTDGGSSWNGTWITATDANLKAIACDADGQDAIKLRATLSIANGIFTPLLEELTIEFESRPVAIYNAVLNNAVLQ